MTKPLNGLAGLRVALLEARMSNELASLIRRAGGEPVCAPAVREAPLEGRDIVEAFLDGLARRAFPVIIFLTGVGAKAVIEEANRLGRQPELIAALQNATIVCRGPKPVAVLKRHGIPIALTAPEPHTTTELLGAVTNLDLKGQGVALIHYGERNTTLTEALRARGAQLTELCLYEWRLPDNLEPLKELVRDAIGGHVEAIAFTSQIQARHLFQIAQEIGLGVELLTALNTTMIVASIGPTCTAALHEFGVMPTVIPEHPKMGHLVAALVEHVERFR